MSKDFIDGVTYVREGLFELLIGFNEDREMIFDDNEKEVLDPVIDSLSRLIKYMDEYINNLRKEPDINSTGNAIFKFKIDRGFKDFRDKSDFVVNKYIEKVKREKYE
jgi:hypothetical protein